MDSSDMGDMDMGGSMGMGSMDMGNGVPNLFYLQKMYWAVLGAAIAFATAVNVFNRLLRRQRLRAAARSSPSPAKPKHVVSQAVATATAIVREISYASPPPVLVKRFRLAWPSTGRLTLALAHLVVLIVFCFWKLNARDQWQWEDIGYRTGFMTICQLPLIFLLAAKKNIVGKLVGSSYERLNWLHRWAARCLFITATIHMGFWMTSWARYDYIVYHIKSDSITQRGLAAWCVLLWIVISSMTPIRGWCYEFFVVQHIVSFAAFVAIVYLHTPAEVHVWVWIPVGLFFFDRLVRGGFLLYNNLSLRKSKDQPGLLACRAQLTPLTHHTTRITIENPPFSWRPGQHVFLSCHLVIPLQSHPFTIASLPSDGKLEVLAHAHAGGTHRLFKHAEKNHHVLPMTNTLSSAQNKSVIVDGPYGNMRPLDQFDSVVLFAGGIGATFVVPLLRDLIRPWTSAGVAANLPKPVTRRVRLVWVVKSRGQMSWFANQLEQIVQELAVYRATMQTNNEKEQRSERGFQSGDGLTVEMSVYVTCDETMTGESTTPSEISSSAGSTSSSTKALSKDRHGRVQEVSTPQNEQTHEKAELSMIEKGPTVQELPSNPDDPQKTSCCAKPSPTQPLQTETECCCTRTISSEAARPTGHCTCNTHAPSSSSSSTLTSSSRPPSITTAPEVPILTGRPHPRNLLRTSLERARGETAVVVCGPRGLADDVRRSVAGLSDERAVHKGTGAQGIWLWTEGFGY